MTILAILAFIGALVSAALFRKGGPYNPVEPTQTDPITTPEAPKQPPETSLPITPVTMPKTPSNGQIMLQKFCDAITTMEGANPANNNPGNCRCSDVGYAPMYGNVTCNPHDFAVFPTKALGRMYLENLVHFRALKHPDWTIITFFQGVPQTDGTYVGGYAPSGDSNDPVHYAGVVAAHCGVIPTISLKELFA